MHWRPPIQGRRKWVSRRNCLQSLLTNCSEMSVFCSYWETWYLVFCEQTCPCGHEVDKILWQTLGAFDLTRSSYKWIPAILLCGKHSTTMQTWIVSRLWFCWRPWRLKINIRRGLVHFRKSHVCANKLDVQETDLGFTQFYKSWTHFFGCRIQVGWYTRTWFMGSDRRRSSRKYESEQTSTGRLCVGTNVTFVQYVTQFKNESNLREWSTIWTMFILLPQTSALLIRKLRCMCLKTTKQWLKWL